MKLSGNKVLITGATSGIGLVLAERFLELGNAVVGVGRNPETLEPLRQKYPCLFPFTCDLADAHGPDALVLHVKQQHPDLNVLINNAAIQYNYHFLEAADIAARADYEINLNLTVPVKLCALLLPVLRLQSEAAVVNVSSGLALVPKKWAPVYCGTKAGLHLFTKARRYQLEGSPGKVFELIPPVVDTPMTAGRGRDKISPVQLVEEFMRAFANDRLEVYVGKVKLLRLLNRLWPSLA
ncbi:MAG: SDR family oxidoreductase, partial [Cytophagales bacterium]|nr:SDR family oxidoreductase [Cytophagales bacterium]